MSDSVSLTSKATTSSGPEGLGIAVSPGTFERGAVPRHDAVDHAGEPVPLGLQLLRVAAVGTAAAVVGLGTFGTFTSTTTQAAGPETAGSVVIALGATGAATNRLDLGATGLVPGDTMQRAFQLSNTGNQSLASITLTTTASPSSLLDTDATNGLQLLIQRCSNVWTEAGTSPAFTYACSGGGTITTVLASRPVIGANVALSSLGSLTNGQTDNLSATLTFPAGHPPSTNVGQRHDGVRRADQHGDVLRRVAPGVVSRRTDGVRSTPSADRRVQTSPS